MATHKLNDLMGRYLKLEAQIDKLEAPIKLLKLERDEVERKLLAQMDKEKLTSASTAGKLLVPVEHPHPSIGDYQSFLKFVVKKKAFDLFQNRISVTAWREFDNAGVVVPGVKVFKKRTLSIRKATKKS